MSRVTVAVPRNARRKKILKSAKGFSGRRKNTFKIAKETVLRALAYNYRDRKVKKRTMRGLWICRISIASKEYGTNYSRLIDGLTKANIGLNRKILADLAVNDKDTFKKLVDITMQAN